MRRLEDEVLVKKLTINVSKREVIVFGRDTRMCAFVFWVRNDRSVPLVMIT